MGSQGPKQRSVLRWVLAGIAVIPVVVGLAADIASLCGYSLKDVKDADKANAVRQAVRALDWPVPIWGIPASWLVFWPLRALILRERQAVRDEASEADSQELLAKVRLAKDIEKDLRLSIEAREGRLHRDLEEVQASKDRFREELHEFRSSVTSQTEELGKAKAEAEAGLETARTSLNQHQLRIRFAEIIFDAIEIQSSHVLHNKYADISRITNLFTESYLARRTEWNTFTDSLVAGSLGKPEPPRQEYVQRMVYYFGALMRSYDAALSETKALGVIPKAAWESAGGGTKIDEEKLNRLADERLGINRDREIIRMLEARSEQVRGTPDAE